PRDAAQLHDRDEIPETTQIHVCPPAPPVHCAPAPISWERRENSVDRIQHGGKPNQNATETTPSARVQGLDSLGAGVADFQDGQKTADFKDLAYTGLQIAQHERAAGLLELFGQQQYHAQAGAGNIIEVRQIEHDAQLALVDL